MPKARRRTLNHCDIDHFLSEIAAVADPKPQKSVDDVAATFLLPIEEPKQKDEASLIRDYCKICFRDSKVVSPTSKNKSVQSIAKSVFELSTYKLIASRMLSPEQFTLPPTSIEAKKSLILSLAPMLTAAEEHRKKETQECEDFTRCKSAKGRGRSSYEYTDVDTAQVVSYEEFETRYLKFIYKDKVSVSKKVTPTITPRILSALQVPTTNTPPPAPSVVVTPIITPTLNVMEADKENIVNQIISTRSRTEKAAAATTGGAAGGVDGGPVKERKRKLVSGGGHDRRGTLSPTSARAMFLSAVEEDCVLPPPPTATTNAATTTTTTGTTATTQSIAPQQQPPTSSASSPVPAPKPSISPMKPFTNNSTTKTMMMLPTTPVTIPVTTSSTTMTGTGTTVAVAAPIDFDFMNTEDDFFWGNPFPTTSTATSSTTTTSSVVPYTVVEDAAPVDLLGLDLLDMLPSSTSTYLTTASSNTTTTTTTTASTTATAAVVASTLFPDTLQVIDDWMSTATGDFTKLQTIEHRLSRSSSGTKWTTISTTGITSGIGGAGMSSTDDLLLLDTNEFDFIDTLEPPIELHHKHHHHTRNNSNKHHHQQQKASSRRESFSYEGILALTESMSKEDASMSNVKTLSDSTSTASSMSNMMSEELLDLSWTPLSVPVPSTGMMTPPTTVSTAVVSVPVVIPVSYVDILPCKVNMSEVEAAASLRREERRKRLELQYHWEVISGQAVNKAIDRMHHATQPSSSV